LSGLGTNPRLVATRCRPDASRAGRHDMHSGQVTAIREVTVNGPASRAALGLGAGQSLDNLWYS